MLLGTFDPSYLGNGRIALPKKIRTELTGDHIILTVGFEACIFGFEEKTWDVVVQPELEKPFFSDTEARRMRRKMCMQAMKVQCDTQGRIVIPDAMITYAHIVESVSIIGAGDHFEIWDAMRWRTYAKEL